MRMIADGSGTVCLGLDCEVNLLTTNVKIQILLSCPHRFIEAVVGRNC